MSQSELLIHTIEALSQSDHEYMLTGSLVSSMQGEPRATHDIDLLVAATTESIEAFLGRFPFDDYYYDVDAAKRAMSAGGMFDIISNTGDKVDIWALTDSAFDRSRFARRQSIEFFGMQLNVSSPEDTILMKLLWSKQSGGSEKQLFDAAKVYEMQQDILDIVYLETWIQELDLEDRFAAMQRFL
ncbi:MAG: hypothetical protein FWC54_02755 [Actinomycetia bacterium]|nr:hypothetical protein [Actinomycetes bacterium]